ncbi:MacB family efflux pump subunit [Paracoccus chinensis]|uniref:Pyoverdine export ATP-binding/permease protein PvdT n=1 Tax=Paracoccus chinensis TaxID=525640 RepID=A0A1G9LQ26_9RHOB|nr:MacB family efflux pump subunit [Paracoccus chinensis]SDL64018.1 macrolide transport system ATP-binding/permease protein [Paracoccus chinensis]
MNPLIQLKGIRRDFPSGDETLTVLHGIDLTIEAGEMVAIIGTSGSGKSTLMNILGCLDRPSAGTYLYSGQDVGALSEEGRARLRRRHFGFIFQRYQLLPDLDALANVEVPAIYAGHPAAQRRSRAAMLLERLGLGQRMDHPPRALSGGQQQRVSVARALMNGGEVILADEPTGALDSRSGAELLELLQELNAEGHTVVIVTHDREVAARAGRVIEMRDGRIISDSCNRATVSAPQRTPATGEGAGFAARVGRLAEAFTMAVRALNAHRLRSFLTMLGIIIGIASVVSVVALGTGSKERVLENISSLGTNTITVRPGSGFGDRRARAIDTLVAADADALSAEPWAASASPEIQTSANVTWRGTSASVSVRGVGVEYFDVGGFTVQEGQAFGREALARRRQVAVLDTEAASAFFPDPALAIGQVLMVGRVPLEVIGVATLTSAGPGPTTPRIFVPYTTVAMRITGQTVVDSISVRVRDEADMAEAEAGIEALLTERHGKKDFFLMNSDTIRSSITSTTQTLTMLISSIAVISLIVGGIGVMNIMLVSVTERTREIGVRMAVGARRSDIVAQFLTEAVLVCLLGGLLGVALALGGGVLLGQLQADLRLVYSAPTIMLAFLSSTLIGIVFGFLPARSAAHLDPVDALSRE